MVVILLYASISESRGEEMYKNVAKKIMAIICICSMLMPYMVYASNTLDSINQAKDQEKELEKKLEAVQETIDRLKSDIESTESYMAKLDDEVNLIAEDIIDINIKIDDKNEQIAQTTIRLEEAQATEQEQYEAMKLRIKYMYESGGGSYFDLLLTAGSISDLLNRAEYASKVSEYDREKLEEYIVIKEKIEADKVLLENEKADLESYMAELENNMESVNMLLDAKTEEMNKLQNDTKAYLAKQEEIQKDIDALDATISKLTSQYNAEQLAKANAVATQGSLYSKALLIWPCPSRYVITSHFSLSRLDPVTQSYYSAHKGTDIGASTGTPVVAAASGLVTAAGFSSSMGNYVVISHGDGITTRYYHNSSLAVSAGQSVKAGQTISYVGSTGYSTGPHLHFEVRINDSPVDPMQFF